MSVGHPPTLVAFIFSFISGVHDAGTNRKKRIMG
jgi:hypothetical protein